MPSGMLLQKAESSFALSQFVVKPTSIQFSMRLWG